MGLHLFYSYASDCEKNCVKCVTVPETEFVIVLLHKSIEGFKRICTNIYKIQMLS